MPLKKKINNLIEKQQAEIEGLRKTNDNLNDIIGDLLDDWSSAIEKAKSEAIKEFAERLKTKVDLDLCEAINCSDYLYDLPKLIDNLVKEMTEGKNNG